jgi:hypothetical protein
MLARTYGIDTPANAVLYELGVKAASSGQAPGTMTEEQLFELLEQREVGTEKIINAQTQ